MHRVGSSKACLLSAAFHSDVQITPDIRFKSTLVSSFQLWQKCDETAAPQIFGTTIPQKHRLWIDQAEETVHEFMWWNLSAMPWEWISLLLSNVPLLLRRFPGFSEVHFSQCRTYFAPCYQWKVFAVNIRGGFLRVYLGGKQIILVDFACFFHSRSICLQVF